MKKLRSSLTISALALTLASYGAYRVEVIQRTGIPGPGSGGANITALNSPFANSTGNPGFTGSFGTHFVWYDTGIVWDSSMFAGLSGAEGTMGISDSGDFIYSPAVNGDDCVWSNAGLILKDGDAAPLIPGKFCTFASRPTMADDGTAYWVSGWSDAPGGSSVGRMLYKYESGLFTIILKTGDAIDGLTVGTSGVGFDYQFSNNGAHWISLTTLTGANANRVLTDTGIIARQGSPTNTSGNWQNFRSLTVNNAGTYAFMGDTDGAAALDDFVAVNGDIVVSEGDTLDNVSLSGNVTRISAIDDDGLIAHVWGAVASSKLFLGRDNVLKGSRFVVGSGSRVSLDSDWEPEATINEIQGSMTIAPAIDIRQNEIYCRALITDDAAGQYVAIIRIPLPKEGDVDLDGEVNLVDFGMLSSAFGTGPDDPAWIAHADIDFDGEVNLVDFSLLSNNFGN